MSYDLYRFDSPEIDISTELTVYPSFTVSGRVRTDAGIRMRYEIIDDLFYEPLGAACVRQRAPIGGCDEQ